MFNNSSLFAQFFVWCILWVALQLLFLALPEDMFGIIVCAPPGISLVLLIIIQNLLSSTQATSNSHFEYQDDTSKDYVLSQYQNRKLLSKQSKNITDKSSITRKSVVEEPQSVTTTEPTILRSKEADLYQLKITTIHDANRSAKTDLQLMPEEMVVQYVLDILKKQYGFNAKDIEVEFPIQMGSAAKRADIVVFMKNAPHRQGNIYLIVECKRADRLHKPHHIAQLQSYMSACMNVRFGVLAADEWLIWEKQLTQSGYIFEAVEFLPTTPANKVDLDYRPPTPDN